MRIVLIGHLDKHALGRIIVLVLGAIVFVAPPIPQCPVTGQLNIGIWPRTLVGLKLNAMTPLVLITTVLNVWG